MRMWQHEDTGVTSEAEKKPGPRWLEVHVVTLGEALRFQRKEIHGWTLQEAADRIGTSKSQIYALENGINKDPRLSMVARFVDVYRMAPSQMMRVAQKKLPKVARNARRVAGWRIKTPPNICL